MRSIVRASLAWLRRGKLASIKSRPGTTADVRADFFGRSGRQPKRPRLCMETLESRLLLSADLSIVSPGLQALLTSLDPAIVQQIERSPLDHTVTVNVTAVPEPGTWLLLAAGIGVIGAFTRRGKAG